MDSIRKFGIKDKVGYMLGDLGNDLFFFLISSYLMLFYTDVFGIPAAAVGGILLIARIWDAGADLAAGIFIDSRKPGPRGKFRPFLIYSALPVTVLGLLTFTNLGILESNRLMYAYITYIAWGTAYSFMNIPYGSLASVMTTDPVERTSLSTWRTIGSITAQTLVMIVAPKIIFSSGGVATPKGFFTIALAFAIFANIAYFYSYKFTVERVKVKNERNKEKSNVINVIKGLGKNRALMGLLIISLTLLTAIMLVGALTPYLYKDYFKAPKLLSLVGFISMGASVTVIPMLSPLVKRFGKKEIVSVGLSIYAIANLSLFLLPIRNPYIFMGITFVAGIGVAFYNVTVWALVSDCIDYQEFLTHKKEQATVYSVFSLTRKLGQAIAGGIGGVALGMVGYVSGSKIQDPVVGEGIKKIITIVPAIAAVIAVLAIVFIYNLSKSKLAELSVQLEVLRKEQ